VSDSPRPEAVDHSAAPRDAAAVLIELANASVTTTDLLGLFTLLANRAVEVLNVEAAGVLVVNPTGALMPIGSSNHRAHLLDLFQIQAEQGPCLECCRSGERVIVTDLADDSQWPLFAQTAREWGYQSVYAMPLASRGMTLGALNLFSSEPLADVDLALAQALADMATLGLIRADPGNDAEVMAMALHQAMESRIAVEQAKGILAVRFGEDADGAFRRLARAAETTGMSLGGVAALVVNRTTTIAVNAALAEGQASTTTPRQKA
jgi:hypothetical protein